VTEEVADDTTGRWLDNTDGDSKRMRRANQKDRESAAGNLHSVL
jgi:hypothetical protein